MTLPWSPELNRVISQAEAEAIRHGQVLATSHLLMTMCMLPGDVSALFRAQGIDSLVLSQMLPYVADEHAGTQQRVLTRASALAGQEMALGVMPVHLLQAMVLDPRCQAYEMLQMAGFNPRMILPDLHGVPATAQRIAANAHRSARGEVREQHPSAAALPAVGSAPRGMGRDVPAGGGAWTSSLQPRWSPEQPTAAVWPAHPLAARDTQDADVGSAWLGETDTADFEPPVMLDPPPRMDPPRMDPPRLPPPPLSAIAQKPELNLPRELVERSRSGLHSAQPTSPTTNTANRSTPSTRPTNNPPSKSNALRPLLGTPSSSDSTRDTTRSPHSLGNKPKSSPTTPSLKQNPSPTSATARNNLNASSSPTPGTSPASRSNNPANTGRRPTRAPDTTLPPANPDAPPTPPEPPASQTDATKRLAQLLFGDSNRPRSASGSGSQTTVDPINDSPRRSDFDRFNLSPRQFPTLARFGRNLLAEARDGKLDPIIGRDREIHLLIDILNKRRSNNPVLVGSAGVGKTAIVEGLARRMVGNDPPPGLSDRALVSLEYGALLSGTQLRGSFQERLIALKKEVQKAEGRIILFLDELHTWLGSGGSDGNTDAIGELKVALARGELPCIGATTTDEFKRFIDADPALERRFDPIRIEPPSAQESLRIIQGTINNYSAHHSVRYSRDAIDAAIKLTDRFIRERQQPDKAISILDRAGAQSRRLGLHEVGREQVAAVISDIAHVPTERLLLEDRDRLLRMEEHMSAHLIGHAPVIERVARTIRRNHAGFASNRPMGSFLLLGPTGVGKTELVKVLAEFMFGSRDAFVRVDMSEFMEKHAVARLLGAPPGYVGFDEGGQLTEALRRQPYQIVLLDEVEKAHPDVLNILLQLLDEGHLSDGHGRKVDFSNAIIILTSNLGSEHIRENRRVNIGFGGGDDSAAAEVREKALEKKILMAAEAAFPLELWNRIEERLVFQPLNREQVAQVAMLQLRDSARRLECDQQISLKFKPELVPFLIEQGGFDAALGARPMRQTIQRLVENTVADAILAQRLVPGQIAMIGVKDGSVTVEVQAGR